MHELKDWQKDGYNVFKKHNNIGIVQASTGSGKTHIGLQLVYDTPLDKKIIIIVPTAVLMYQWRNKIKQFIPIITDVGLIGDGHFKEERVTIAIINSVRELQMRYDILILDEAHRFLSDMNVKFLENNKFEQILGLSATITREDERTYDRFNLKTIYDYTQADAIKNKDLCEYNLINVGVDLTEAEQKQYKANDEIIKALVPKFKDNIFSGKWSPEKTKLRKAINARKSILYGAENKVNRTVRIIEENAGGKIIVFSEYIYTVNELQKALKEKGIESMVYHSKSKSSDRKIVIEDFRDGKCNVMLSVRALDEGFDMIETNIGIILAGNKTARQIIQRIGRILRYKDEPAKIYQLFTRSTVETKWLMERLGFIKGYNELKYE